MKITHLALLLLVLFAGAFRGLAAAHTNSLATDAPSFRIISDLSIFNPNRRPIYNPRTNGPVVPRPDWFTLTGTMSYPNDTTRQKYAFFEGSNRQYQRVFNASESIAGFKITEIANDYVKLAGTSNKVVTLRVQSQMRKPYGGSWSVLASPDAPPEPAEPTAAADDGSGAPAATGDAPAAPASTGNVSDDEATRRMIERRLKEESGK